MQAVTRNELEDMNDLRNLVWLQTTIYLVSDKRSTSTSVLYNVLGVKEQAVTGSVV